MRNPALILFLSIFALYMAGCDNIATEEQERDLVTIAEDEISYLKSAESVDEEICAARFGSHLSGHNYLFKVPRFLLGRHFPYCADVSVSGPSFPKEIVITYGDDCLTRSGLTKSGTITITISDTITNPGATYTVLFDNVTVGDRTIEKTATVVNEGMNEDGNWVITVNVVTTVNHSDTLKITRDYSLMQEWISGFGTPEIDDDYFLVTGDGTISVNDEVTFQRTITEALIIDRSCRFITGGIIEISKDEEVMTIDFGNGECDNIAVVTKDGESEEIELIGGKFRKEFNRNHHHICKRQGWW